MHTYILFSHRPGSNFQIILDVSFFHCENMLFPASEHSPDAEATLPHAQPSPARPGLV